MRHVIGVLVENEFGVLSRISGLFSGRGFNIESLSVAETDDPRLSHMTIVTRGDDQIIEQITKQLNKLVNVLKVVDFTETDHVSRGMMLVKIAAEGAKRVELLSIVEVFRARVIDLSPRAMIVEVTGTDSKLHAFLETAVSFGIKDISRTGMVAMTRDGAPKARAGAQVRAA
ncbi:MAG: acetolactate synthase small subunit [Deltaproteobacteria bacterium]|nr:acetolactate synthase small subunit [Candidatus Anaeroferrophillacea bacterium]